MKPQDNWKAQMDANTLAEAEAIKQDPARMSGAANAARAMAKEQQARLEGLKAVAAKAPANTPANATGFWRRR